MMVAYVQEADGSIGPALGMVKAMFGMGGGNNKEEL